MKIVAFILVCYLTVLTNLFIVYHFDNGKTRGIVIDVTGHDFCFKKNDYQYFFVTDPILETVNMFYIGMVNFSNKIMQYPLSRTKIMEKLQTRQIWGIWKLRPAYSPETPNLGQNRWCFVPCDLEIWRMTLENKRAPLLCCFKLCGTFHSHWWIQTGVTVRKHPIWVKFDDF